MCPATCEAGPAAGFSNSGQRPHSGHRGLSKGPWPAGAGASAVAPRTLVRKRLSSVASAGRVPGRVSLAGQSFPAVRLEEGLWPRSYPCHALLGGTGSGDRGQRTGVGRTPSVSRQAPNCADIWLLWLLCCAHSGVLPLALPFPVLGKHVSGCVTSQVVELAICCWQGKP